MIRGFVSGIVWGSAVAVLGLGTASLVAPDRAGMVGANAVDAPSPGVVVPDAATAEPVAVAPKDVAEVKVPVADTPAKPAVPDSAPVPDAPPQPDAAVVPAVPVEAKPDAVPAVPKPDAGVAPLADAGVAPAPLQLPKAGGDVLPDLPAPAPAIAAPKPKAPGAAIVPLAEPIPQVQPDGAGPAQPPAVPVLLEPAVPQSPDVGTAPAFAPQPDVAAPIITDAKPPVIGTPELAPGQADLPPALPAELRRDALLKPAAPAEPAAIVPADPEPAPDAMPAIEPADAPADDSVLPPPERLVIEDPAAPSTLLPDTGLNATPDGVTTNRLPRVGDPAPAQDDNADDIALDGSADGPPLATFARAVDNPDKKPLFALILIDTGAAGVDRAELAALPFAVSFVVDPLSPDAAATAKIYRDAGQEVLMAATGIPAGATAADLEQTFQAHASALPEAVAVVDLATGGFQDDRPLATLVVPIIKGQGRGLLTYDRGLNAADQVARRDDLATIAIFRSLDGEGEDTPVIRRYLDRAAFKAAQEGRVAVIGDARPETVAALLEWTVEGRADSVMLAPASAVLQID